MPPTDLQQLRGDVAGVSASTLPGETFVQRQDYGGRQGLVGAPRQFGCESTCFVILNIQMHFAASSR
jgi:hypothetical protein